MPLVNLIQEQRSVIQNQERRFRIFFYTFVGVTGISLMTAAMFFLDAQLASFEINSLRRKLALNKPLEDQILDNQQKAQAMAPKLTTLQDAQKWTQRWGRILDYLSRNTPTSAFLTSIKTNGNDVTKPLQLSISGMAVSQETVGEFILRLQAIEDLQQVTLKFTQEKTSDVGRGIEFEIGAEITGTAEIQDKPKEEKKAGGAA